VNYSAQGRVNNVAFDTNALSRLRTRWRIGAVARDETLPPVAATSGASQAWRWASGQALSL
ncbi:MAG: hypothetical protein ACR2L2_02600, partial [Acidobacteriota bacterium]